MSNVERYWARPPEDLLALLETRAAGLTGPEAEERLKRFGGNTLTRPAVLPPWVRLLLSRFANPLVVILVVAALVSLVVRDWVDAWIVLGIILLTAVLGCIQEHRANLAVEALRRRVGVTASTLRDGIAQEIPVDRVVPGDVVELSAGALVPADGVVLEATSCNVSQAVLTGETLPVEKQPGPCPAEAGVAQRTNCMYMGTSVRSGTARMLVVDTGRATIYGAIAGKLQLRSPETEFERGLRRFGAMLIGLMLAVVAAILAVNLVLHRPTIETLLFAAALAVGLSPELLPAILTITLAHGARVMARRGVIVKRLNAIENLGSMNVLCTDKTGTLTRGVLELDAALGPDGKPDAGMLRLAWINARFQTGIRNPLDEAIVARGQREGMQDAGLSKVDEIPYDFLYRRLSVVVLDARTGETTMIMKGAFESVFEACTHARAGDRDILLDAPMRSRMKRKFRAWSAKGYRVLALATRKVEAGRHVRREDERDMVLAGFLLFFDPPEPQVSTTLAKLRGLGVDMKIITGDNRFVTRHVADAIGMQVTGTLTGEQLHRLGEEALWHLAPSITLFSEIDPNQKERIITALRRTGHVVGFLGDGINDAPALHAADVGISVDHAVDVAKEAADFVLLEHDLDVLGQGIEEGRRTFANTIKYIFITTSANFGNMISMALASLFLPFLPLLAKQILLNNFLSDIPSMGIAGDNVDSAWTRTPHRWDMRLILRSMLTFGLISTFFDLLTFGALLGLAGEAVRVFRTGWFLESLLTELWVLMIIRTHRTFYRSRPGRFLLWSVGAVTLIALALPYLPAAVPFGFVPLSPAMLAIVLAITALYLAASEGGKRWFYRSAGLDGAPDGRFPASP